MFNDEPVGTEILILRFKLEPFIASIPVLRFNIQPKHMLAPVKLPMFL